MMVSQASGRMAAQHISAAVLWSDFALGFTVSIYLLLTDENASSIIQNIFLEHYYLKLLNEHHPNTF